MRVIALLAALVAAAAVSASALADPSHNVLPNTTLTCDNGATVVVNPGTVTNRSHMGFVVGSTSIMVVNYVAFTDATGTLVLVDSAPALSGQELVTCTGDAGFGGFTVTVRGFLTPPR